MTDQRALDVAPAEGTVAAAEPAPMAPADSTPTVAQAPALRAAEPSAPLADPTHEPIDDAAAVAAAETPAPPSASGAEIPPAAEPEAAAASVPSMLAPEHGSDLAASALTSPPAAAETLDFAALAARLRKTKAINLRTKVAVKNESDDLLESFRAYHDQRGTATMAELRRSYDSLFRKLYSLLEDADPPLARDIDRSRAAIWAILTDPRKFEASAPTVAARNVPRA